MQLINIKYQVDKSDVEKSNQSVQKAKDLTEQLKKSTKGLGDQSKKSNKDFQGSIEGVRQKMQQLKAQIDLTARSDAKRLNDLIRQYQQAKKEVDDFTKRLKTQNQATQQAAQSTNNLAGGFLSMYNAIKLVVGAAIVRELVNTTLEAAKLSGNVEAVGRAFQRQIPNAEAVLNDLRRATRGTVNDLDLMQRALKFQNFGGDVQKLGSLLEFAAVRAQQTGESVDYMVNSIVTGIGRKSILILDNLGISATRLKENFNGASLASQSVAEVTRVVGKIAEEELVKMGGFAENSATQVDQLKVAWHELRVELSKFFTEGAGGGVVGFFKSYVDTFKDLVEAQNRGISASELYAERERERVAQVSANVFMNRQLTGTTEENIEVLEREIALLTTSLGEFAKERDSAKRTIEVLRELQFARGANAYEVEEQIRLQKRSIESKLEDVMIDQEILKLLQSKLQALQKENALKEKDVTTLKTLKDNLRELNRIREEETSILNQEEIDHLARLIAKQEDEILKIEDNIAWQRKWNDQTIITKLAQENLTRSLEEQKRAIEEIGKVINNQPDWGRTENFNIEIPLEVIPDTRFDNEAWTRARMKIKEWWKDSWDEIASDGIDNVGMALQTVVDVELFNQQQRIENLRAFYEEQQLLAGDNERAQQELRIKEKQETEKLERELAIKQKRARLHSIAIDTAAAIAKAWVNPGWPSAIPLSAFLLAQGAFQAAVVQRAPLGFKDGVIDLKGPGTSTSDSIRANLSKGESVMTAKETQASKGILTAIRAKKLDDQKLARMAAANGAGRDGGVFDASGIIQATKRVEKAIASNDIVRKGSIIYDAKKEGDNFTTYMRSKNLRG